MKSCRTASFGVLLFLGGLLTGWSAEPGSETKPRFDRVPGVVIDHSPASSGQYIGSPSIAILPGGDYVASHDLFGPKSTEHTSARSAVFRSRDRGRTWAKISEIQGAFWSTLFVHRGALYLIGTDRHHGNAVIRRSRDGGATWTVPADRASGLLRDHGEYHCAPMPVLEHEGRLWRGMEWRNPPEAWGINYCAGMFSVPVDADLLDAGQWTFSEFLPSNRAWNGGDMGAWLEGNAVVAPDGELVDVLRVQTKSPDEKAAIVRLTPDGKKASFDPATGFVPFPGGAKKFSIRFDPRSKLYWSIATIVAERHRADNPGSIRNTLALVSSPDLAQWTTRTILLYHPDTAKHGFQYVDWLFEGDDLIAACRTAHDDGLGGAHNNHDANFLTFHRWKDFRGLTHADSPAGLARIFDGDAAPSPRFSGPPRRGRRSSNEQAAETTRRHYANIASEGSGLRRFQTPESSRERTQRSDRFSALYAFSCGYLRLVAAAPRCEIFGLAPRLAHISSTTHAVRRRDIHGGAVSNRPKPVGRSFLGGWETAAPPRRQPKLLKHNCGPSAGLAPHR